MLKNPMRPLISGHVKIADLMAAWLFSNNLIIFQFVINL